MTEGGWQSRRAYPLLLSVEAEMAVTRYRADKNISMGKALNELVKIALYTTNYMADPARCAHKWDQKILWSKEGSTKIWACTECKVHASLEQFNQLEKIRNYKPRGPIELEAKA